MAGKGRRGGSIYTSEAVACFVYNMVIHSAKDVEELPHYSLNTTPT
jgi:hypothetical protein